MAFKAMAMLKINPDGTIEGRVGEEEIDGIGLIENGVYEIGLDTFHCELRVQYKGKEEQGELFRN